METASQPEWPSCCRTIASGADDRIEEQIEERCSGYHEAAHHGAKTNLGSIRREELVHAASELNETEEADAEEEGRRLNGARIANATRAILGRLLGLGDRLALDVAIGQHALVLRLIANNQDGSGENEHGGDTSEHQITSPPASSLNDRGDDGAHDEHVNRVHCPSETNCQPPDFLNHWSITSDMATPVVKAKQTPIKAPAAMNIQTSV